MINFEKIDDKYFVFSDNDIWKYGPFDSLWAKWIFLWNNFLYDLSNLKSYKHVVWVYFNNFYLLEEVKWKLFLKK